MVFLFKVVVLRPQVTKKTSSIRQRLLVYLDFSTQPIEKKDL